MPPSVPAASCTISSAAALLAGLLLFPALPGAADAPSSSRIEEGQELLDEARQAVEAGDCRGASKLLRKADRNFEGRSAEVHFLTGVCAYLLGRFEEAGGHAGRALEMDLTDEMRAAALELRARSRLADFQIGAGERRKTLEKATAESGSARPLEETPREPAQEAGELREAMARLYHEILALIEGDLREALELAGDRANPGRYYLAQVLGLRHEDEEAREVLERYLEQGASPETREAAEAMRCLLDRRREFEAAKVTGGSQGAEGVKVPHRVSGPWPQYPERARLARIRGTVVLQAMVEESGEIQCVFPLQGLPLGLTEATLKALRQWEFEPVLEEGKPVSVYYNLSVEFNLQ